MQFSKKPVFSTENADFKIKAPLLFAEGGEKEEKAGAKNEKAILIITELKNTSIQTNKNFKNNFKNNFFTP